MKNRWLGFCALLASFMAVQSSQADLIAFSVGGRFTAVEGLGLAVGDRFSATYTFESGQSDLLPTPGGDYALTSYRFVVPALGLDVTGTGSGIAVVNGAQDQYAAAFEILPNISINDIGLFELTFSLIDLTGVVFSDESIFVVPPALSSFQDNRFDLRGSSLENCAAVVCDNSGIIDGFSVVPEPSTPAVLLAGLMLLIAVQLAGRRPQRRNQGIQAPQLR